MNDLTWIFLFNIIVNSFLSLCCCWGLTYLFIKIFKVQHPRIKAILLGAVILKLCIDPFLYGYAEWALSSGVNPWLCKGARNVVIGCGFYDPIWFFHMGLHLDNGLSFSIADMLALKLSMGVIKIGVGAVLLIAFTRLIYFGFSVGRSVLYLSRLMADSTKYMRQGKIDVYVSADIQTPMATGVFNRKVVLPQFIVKRWERPEIQAVIAHEIEHLKWYDPLVTCFLKGVQALFWWVPLKGLTRSIHHHVELACDRAIFKKGIRPHYLLQAFLKLADKEPTQLWTASNFAMQYPLSERAHALEKAMSRPGSKLSIKIKYLLVGMLIASLWVSKLWIF